MRFVPMLAALAFVAACKPHPTSTVATIGPAGGAVTLPDGTTVRVPAGALTANIAISIKPLAAPPTVAGASWAGPVYELGPAGVTFAQPVDIVLPVQAAGRNPADIVVETAPSGSNAFTMIPNEIVDANHVRVSTTHFSYYGAAFFVGDLPPGQMCAPVSCDWVWYRARNCLLQQSCLDGARASGDGFAQGWFDSLTLCLRTKCHEECSVDGPPPSGQQIGACNGCIGAAFGPFGACHASEEACVQDGRICRGCGMLGQQPCVDMGLDMTVADMAPPPDMTSCAPGPPPTSNTECVLEYVPPTNGGSAGCMVPQSQCDVQKSCGGHDYELVCSGVDSIACNCNVDGATTKTLSFASCGQWPSGQVAVLWQDCQFP